jgi:hypothetical protein
MTRLICAAVLLIAIPACACAQCIGDVEVDKYVDFAAAPVGFVVTYEIFLENATDCIVYLDHVHDTLLGDMTADFPPFLYPGEMVSHVYSYEIQPEDPDPLVNHVNCAYTDEYGGVSDVTGSAEVDVLHPSFEVEMMCFNPPPEPGMDAEFLMVVTNTGDVTLNCTFDGYPNTPPPFVIEAPGNYEYAQWVPCVGAEVCAGVVAEAHLPPEYGIEYVLIASDEACCACNGNPVEEESWGTIKALWR